MIEPSEFAKKQEAFRKELTELLNRHSAENCSNTPDYVLANYLLSCLSGFDAATRMRDGFYGYRQFINVTVTSDASKNSLVLGKPGD